MFPKFVSLCYSRLHVRVFILFISINLVCEQLLPDLDWNHDFYVGNIFKNDLYLIECPIVPNDVTILYVNVVGNLALVIYFYCRVLLVFLVTRGPTKFTLIVKCVIHLESRFPVLRAN